MSTGLECEFVQWRDDQWFYVLQNWDCPVGAWDWREFATAYGPFPTFEQADEHLRLNHANPGGHYTYGHGEGESEERRLRTEQELERIRQDQTYQKLFTEAENPAPRSPYRRGEYPWGR